jgi:hypothetical protein
MEFRTNIEIKRSELTINHRSKNMLFGSCFAERIGRLLQENKFDVCVNPFGVLYNPVSVATAIRRIHSRRTVAETELVYRDGLFHSFYYHGAFSNAGKNECLADMNNALHAAAEKLSQTDTLLVTFGTSYVFKRRDTGEVVANCHKFPDSEFERYRLTTDEIVEDWSALIRQLREDNPSVRLLFTISPVRHLKDGAHGNQLSKAVLLLAVEALQRQFADVYYFPSYELLLDDLRDYRFYADDMLHPSEAALKYIWKAFGNAFFDGGTNQLLQEWTGIKQAIAHRPFNGGTNGHKQFLKQTLLRITAFRKKYPYFAMDNEIAEIESRLGKE